MSLHRTLLCLLCLLSILCAHAQVPDAYLPDSASSSVSEKYLTTIASRAGHLENKLDEQSEKALKRWTRQEAKLRRKLAGTDSLKAAQVFGTGKERYRQLQQQLNSGTSSLKQYIPSLDTIGSALKFLQQTPGFLSSSKGAQQKLAGALSKVNGLEGKFQQAEEIKKFLKERKEYLKQQLGELGFAKQLKQLNKQAYYYSAQVSEYKSLLKDHKKAETKAIALLTKTKLFKDFLRKNSQLASLFRLPGGDPNDPAALASLAGLQTRAQVNNLIQQQIGSGGPGAQAQVQQNMQSAQSQLAQLKNKISQAGGQGSDAEMPEGFKPNDQKTKSFFRRLQLGTNIQSQRASGFFPTTSDLGLSLGYKLGEKNIIGIGASYKTGWGPDIRHIKISHQGVGLRSFIDWKIKGSFWLSGGYEMNYRSEFKQFEQLKDLNAWQQSGLIGISKVISMKTKLLKQTKLQLLWDVLSYGQVPRTQSVLFRIGYSF